MKYFSKSVFVLIVLITSNCSSNKAVSSELSKDIEEVYFQKWIGGQELSGSGTNFYLKLQQPLALNTSITKVYFQQQEAVFEKEDATTFVAHFYSKTANSDLIMDGNSNNEYGNKAPEIKSKSTNVGADLNPNDAIIEYNSNNKIVQVKITNIKEKELLAYPSTKPRN
jgi:hypothetical protein